MKLFLIMIFFAARVLAEQIMAPNITYIMPSRGNVQWDIESLLEAYKRDLRDKGVGYVSENIGRIGVHPFQSDRDALEYISRAAKLQGYMSGLISRSGGKLCGLSQDPIQCCNAFAPSPDQCLSKAIEKGINLSDLKEGVCNVAQNVEGCASQVNSTVLLQLMSEQPGTIHQFSVPPVVDYESLQVHQLGQTAGVIHFSTMDYQGVKNYPEIQRVMEELNGYSVEALKKLYEGVEAPPAFPVGR